MDECCETPVQRWSVEVANLVGEKKMRLGLMTEDFGAGLHKCLLYVLVEVTAVESCASGRFELIICWESLKISQHPVLACEYCRDSV